MSDPEGNRNLKDFPLQFYSFHSSSPSLLTLVKVVNNFARVLLQDEGTRRAGRLRNVCLTQARIFLKATAFLSQHVFCSLTHSLLTIIIVMMMVPCSRPSRQQELDVQNMPSTSDQNDRSH